MLPINSSVSECFQTTLKLIPYPSRVTRGALVLSFISDAGTLLSVCSEDHSNMSDLTLEMGCNLSFPRALCLILLIREREKRVSSLSSLSQRTHKVLSVCSLYTPPLLSLLLSLYQLPD